MKFVASRNQHQPSRGIETSPLLTRPKLDNAVEININPVEGLKLTVAMSERRALIGSRNQHQPSRGIETTLVGDYWESERHVEININPVEGLKLT